MQLIKQLDNFLAARPHTTHDTQLFHEQCVCLCACGSHSVIIAFARPQAAYHHLLTHHHRPPDFSVTDPERGAGPQQKKKKKKKNQDKRQAHGNLKGG